MEGIFTWYSKQLDDQDTPYYVMDLVVAAVSILIWCLISEGNGNDFFVI